MSTQKWSDDDLDDLFRQSAEESDPAYDPAAWQDLKTRLNERDRTLLRTRLLRWTLPLLLLLLSTAGLVWYARQATTHQPTATAGELVTGRTAQSGRSSVARPVPHDAPVSPASRSPITALAPESTGSQPEDIPSAPNNPVRGPAAAGHPDENTAGSSVAGRRAQPVADNRTRNPDAANPLTYDPVTSSERTQPARSRSAPAPGFLHTGRTTETKTGRVQPDNNRSRQTKRKLPVAYPEVELLATGQSIRRRHDTARQDATGGLGRHRSVVSGLVTTQDVARNTASNTLTGVEPASPVASERATNSEDLAPTDRFNWPVVRLSAKNANWPALSPSLAEPVAPESAASRTRPARPLGLSIQLVAAPDLTTVGLRNFDRPGTNLGLMAQYQLAERFSVQAGALWSTKRYTTTPSEYVWPFSGYTHVYPESVTGNCTMFDIPVNLRYDVLLRPGSVVGSPGRWFVSGGVTSYFIRHEVYNYTYANPDDPAITRRSWDNKRAGAKGGKFGLSHLNVSLGYERSISRRLSWQVEPFMKIPMQQVGFFKVRLLSTGAFVSLRYRL